MAADYFHQVPYELPNGDIIIADTCYCGEQRMDEPLYLVHYTDVDAYMIAHGPCLEVVDVEYIDS